MGKIFMKSCFERRPLQKDWEDLLDVLPTWNFHFSKHRLVLLKSMFSVCPMASAFRTFQHLFVGRCFNLVINTTVFCFFFLPSPTETYCFKFPESTSKKAKSMLPPMVSNKRFNLFETRQVLLQCQKNHDLGESG